jgi:hypothetical protein
MRLFRSRKEEEIAAPSAPPPITWTRALDNSGTLDEDARQKLIADLQLIAAPWCVPLLERAVEEEHHEALRTAAERALEECRRQRF